MGKIQTDVIKKSIKKKSTKIISLEKATLYKFFIYNEEQEKWTFNEDSFNQLEMKKNMANKERKTPLVLFINSHENDSVSVVSKFINRDYLLFQNIGIYWTNTWTNVADVLEYG